MYLFSDGSEGSNRLQEQHLLFSLAGTTATEVSHRGLQFDDTLSSLFDGTKVTRPVPIMVEGEYAVLNRATRKYQKVKITAEDIKSYANNTPRDVAVNYEHVRGDRPKGWVRLKDTARIGTLDTREGPKQALFASLELYDDAAQDVARGYFRDVSIELKPIVKEIIGTALTSSPVMRDLQFYANGPIDEPADVNPEDGAPAVDEPVQDNPIAASEPTAEPGDSSIDNPSDPSKEDTMKDTPADSGQDRQLVLAEALQEYGLTPEDLKALPDLIHRAEFAERQGRLNAARDRIRKLVTNDQGKTVLTSTGVEAAAQLLVFSQDHADEDLVFSVEGVTDEEGKAKSLDIDALFGELFSSIEAVQVFGQTPGVPADQIEPNIPEGVEGDESAGLDEDRVSRIAARIKGQLKQGS